MLPVNMQGTKAPGQFLLPTEGVEELASGYVLTDDGGSAEGPVWWQEGGYLLFSDIYLSRIMKWSPNDGVTVFRESTNQANELTRDPQGRLVICERSARRVTRLEPDGGITVITNNYQGVNLNRPNDVAVRSDGSIYFTDPEAPSPELDLDYCGVYHVTPDLSRISLILKDFVLPNGLAFSPDESTLYVVDSAWGHIRAFTVLSDEMLALGSDRVLCEVEGEWPNGMKVDVEGNIYCAGSKGISIVDSSGRRLGTIPTLERAMNLAWGGGDWKTLFFTTMHTLASVRWRIPGVPVPALSP